MMKTLQPNINKTEVVEYDTRPDEAIVLESLCVNCEKMGETRLLLTEIPFFKEIVVMSFSCPHCGYKNNEIQPAGTLEEYGVKISLNVTERSDLERDIIRSNHATVIIPELQLEIPSTGKGYLSTLEGFLSSFKEDLEINQDYRREQNPDVADQIDIFIAKVQKYIDCDPEILPFTFILDDPSGHSNIKNPFAPNQDPNIKTEKYVRTVEQITAMGYTPENAENMTKEQLELQENKKSKENNTAVDNKQKKAVYTQEQTDELIKNLSKKNKTIDAHGRNFAKPLDDSEAGIDTQLESLTFPTICHNCFNENGVTRMCTCEIPYFKEIIVMAFTCDQCGARSTEVKTGGGVSKQAKKTTIRINKPEDLNRD